MDYIGFSVYRRTFMGDRQFLDGLGIKGEEPEEIYPHILEVVEKIVDQFPERKNLGSVIHFCNFTELLLKDFIIDPWFEALKTAKLKYPFVLGNHINFKDPYRPLTPGFIGMFKDTMKLCKKLSVDALVLHAPMIHGNIEDTIENPI